MSKAVNILILDDEESLLELYSEILERKLPVKFSLITVKNGNDALRIIRDSNILFDLMMTDILHPGISCFELIEIIRREFPYMKVFIFSHACRAFSDQLSLADAYLPKESSQVTDIINVIKRLLGV